MPRLIVEDGTIVTNANSYASLAVIRAYNDQRGAELPDDDDTVMQLATVAMDVLAGYGRRWKGNRAYPLLQVLDWPRTDVVLYGQAVLNTFIPPQVISAQCYLVGVAVTVDLLPVTSERALIVDKLGPLESDYSDRYGSLLSPIMPNLDMLLDPLINAGGGSLRVVRV